ncbi:hypothetical protein ACFSTH_20125 [Paenibacillus yanchengensis]
MTGCVIAIEHKKLQQSNNLREKILFYSLLLVANVIGILWGFGIELPSPLYLLEFLGKPFMFLN